MPKLSVVVPAHGVQEFLADCLWSIVTQDLQDLEVIVVDDASPDQTGAIAAEFARRDPRIRVVSHPVNRGVGAARNTGLAHATGEYIAFPDSDDIVARSAYSRLVTSLDASGSDFITAPADEFGGRRRRYWTTDNEAFDRSVRRTNLVETPALIEDHTPWTRLYRRSFLISHGIVWPEDGKSEDIVQSAIAYARAEAIDVDAEVAYHYRRRRGSATASIGLESDFAEWLQQMSRALDAAESVPSAARSHMAAKILTREFLDRRRIDVLAGAAGDIVKAAAAIVRRAIDDVDDEALASLLPKDKWRLALVASGGVEHLAALDEGPVRLGFGASLGSLVSSIPERLVESLGHEAFADIDGADLVGSTALISAGRQVITSYTGIPELSVIIPTYNVVTFIDELLRSIRAAVDVRLEIIVVDDSSSDGTWERLEHHAAEDPRVSILRSPGRGGGQARNAGIEIARGEYLAFADGDDIVPPAVYRTMLDAAIRTDAEIVSGRHVKFFTTTTWDPKALLYPVDAEVTGATLADLPQLIHPRMVWNRVFRRDFWAEKALSFPGVPRVNDIAPFTSALVAAQRITYLPIITYIYRDRPGRGSMTAKLGAPSSMVSFLSEEETCAHLIRDIDSKPLELKYWAVVLGEDGWGNFGKYFAAQKLVDFSDKTVAVAARRLLALAPRAAIRELSPEQQLVWALAARGEMRLAAVLHDSHRDIRSVPLGDVLELMIAVLDLDEALPRSVQYLLWKYVVRRVLDDGDAVTPILVSRAIEVLTSARSGFRPVSVPGSLEDGFMRAVEAGSANAILELRAPATEHPTAVFLPRRDGGVVMSDAADGAHSYRALYARQRGKDTRLPIALIDFDAEGARWRAEIDADRLPPKGEWEVWVEYEHTSGLRNSPLGHLVLGGQIESSSRIAVQMIAADKKGVKVVVSVAEEIGAIRALRFVGASGSIDVALRAMDGGLVEGRLPITSIGDDPYELIAQVDTPYGPSDFQVLVTAEAVTSRATGPLLIADEGRLRRLSADEDGSGLGARSFAARYLSASVREAQFHGGEITLLVVPGPGASIASIRLWRQVHGAVRARAFELSRNGDGTLVVSRETRTLARQRWTLLATFETPLGAVEFPVPIPQDVIVSRSGTEHVRTNGAALQIVSGHAPDAEPDVKTVVPTATSQKAARGATFVSRGRRVAGRILRKLRADGE